MTKKKTLLIAIISFIVIFVATIISIGVVYASDNAGNIAYLYNINPLVPSISYETNGNNITISDDNGELKLSKYDLVVVSDKLPFTSLEPTKSYLDSDSKYHLVYTNLDATTNKTLVNNNSANITYIKPLINKCSYEEDNVTKYISYNNNYVSSTHDLKLLSMGRGYNPTRNNVNELISYANVIYALGDINLDENVVLDIPCSLDLLSFDLNLLSTLTIKNQYGGSFYVKGTISSTENLFVTAPNSNYYFYGTLANENDATIICSGDTYSNLLVDALDFIEYIIPPSTFDNTINLYSHYMLFNVDYTYEFSTNDGVSYSSYNDVNLMTLLSRGTNTKNIKIRVTASKGEDTLSRVIDTKVYGTNEASFALALKDAITENASYRRVEQINLLGILKYVGSYFNSSTVNIILNEDKYLDAYFVVNGINDYELDNISITKESSTYKIGTTTLTSLLIHKGLVNLNSSTSFSVNVASNIEAGSLAFVSDSSQDIKTYLVSHTSSVSTENVYNIYNVRQDGLYLGSTKISDSSLNISSISLSVIDNNTPEDIEDYFTLNANEDDNSIIESITFNQDIQDLKSAYLVYEVTLNDNSSFTYKVQIARVVEGQAGSETTFKSSNPFDDVFSQTDTNWLVGTTFDFNKLTNYPASYYASIEIISIDDTSYDGSAIQRTEVENGVNYTYDISKIVSVTGNSNQTKVIQGKNVYRSLDINIDINYVPARNVKFICKCIAFDDTEVSVEQDYIVTIPGILKCQGDSYASSSKTPYIFKDSNLYSMCVSLFDEIDDNLVDPLINNYKLTEESSDHYYILSDAIDYKGELDFSSLSNVNVGEGLDLTGLENLSKISSINLSGFAIKDLSSYQYGDKLDLKTLNLSSCSLSDNKLFLDSSSPSYLYGLNLVNVNLSNNNITRTKDLVYRSVTTLSLANQTNLSSIDGLTNLIYLENADLSNNKIFRFNSIRDMNSLVNVYLYGNVPSKLTSVYGSNGSINLPVYVWMIKTIPNIKIFAYEANNNDNSNYLRFSDSVGTNNISLEKVDACVSLNAFAVPSNIYVREDLELVLPQYGEIHESYRRVGRPNQAGIDENNVSSYYYFDGTDYVQGDISTLSDDKVYYELISHTDDYSIFFMETDGALSVTYNALIDSNFDEQYSEYSFFGTYSEGVEASYILAYTDSSRRVIACREFVITLYC